MTAKLAAGPAIGPLVVVQVPAVEINPAKYNPRDISESSFEGLKESLKKFGFTQPLVVNRKTGNLVSGHQRLKAANALGMTHVPVVYVDLSVAEEKALNVTLNNQRISGYFTDTLQDLLAEIREEFSDEDMAALKLSELEVDDSWDDGADTVEDAEETLDGLKAVIKVKCPQELKDEVLLFLKGKLLESSFEGVEVV